MERWERSISARDHHVEKFGRVLGGGGGGLHSYHRFPEVKFLCVWGGGGCTFIKLFLACALIRVCDTTCQMRLPTSDFIPIAGGQGLRDDDVDGIRQHIALRPPVNRREAQEAVETVGFIPIAMDIVPPVPNAMFIDHVRAPP